MFTAFHIIFSFGGYIFAGQEQYLGKEVSLGSNKKFSALQM